MDKFDKIMVGIGLSLVGILVGFLVGIKVGIVVSILALFLVLHALFRMGVGR